MTEPAVPEALQRAAEAAAAAIAGIVREPRDTEAKVRRATENLARIFIRHVLAAKVCADPEHALLSHKVSDWAESKAMTDLLGCGGSYADLEREANELALRAEAAEQALAAAQAERDSERERCRTITVGYRQMRKDIDAALGVTSEERQAETGAAGLRSAVMLLLKRYDAAKHRAEETTEPTQAELVTALEDQLGEATANWHDALVAKSAAEARVLEVEAELSMANDALTEARIAAGDDDRPFLDDVVSNLKAERDRLRALLLDADHEWALWAEKWMATLDTLGRLAARVARLEREHS